MRLTGALLLACAVVFGATVTGVAQDAGDPVVTDETITVGDGSVPDEEIRRRIIEVFAEIDRFANVDVEVQAGVVTLTGEVLDTTAERELGEIVSRVEGVIAVDNQVSQSTDISERLAPAFDRMLDRFDDLVANAPVIAVALLIFLAVALLGWIVTARLGFWERLAPNSFIADIYRAITRIVFVVVGVVLALDVLNATALLGAVLGAAGVVGLAVGFAVRDTVENFIASVMLSLRQPFRPNDFVEIDGQEGNVARLTSRATILISPEGNHIRIPNATVFKGRITNFTRNPNRRFTFDLGVDAESDLAAALATAVKAIEDLPFVLRSPEVSAWVKDVGDSNVVLTFAGWVDQRTTDFLKARGEAVRTAKMALEANGFGLPEPIYRLRIDGALPASGDAAAAPAPRPPTPHATPPAALPEAAEPERKEKGAEDAVAEERAASDTGEDLLNPRQPTE